MAKKPSPKTGTDTARKIWLAGIGAYGRAFSDAQESLARVNADSTKLFEDLVAKGEEIEDTVETKGRELAKRVKHPAVSMDDRIQNMRERLGLSLEGSSENMSHFEERLELIERKLDLLLALTEQNGSTKAKRKSTTKKTAKKKTS